MRYWNRHWGRDGRGLITKICLNSVTNCTQRVFFLALFTLTLTLPFEECIENRAWLWRILKCIIFTKDMGQTLAQNVGVNVCLSWWCIRITVFLLCNSIDKSDSMYISRTNTHWSHATCSLVHHWPLVTVSSNYILSWHVTTPANQWPQQWFAWCSHFKMRCCCRTG